MGRTIIWIFWQALRPATITWQDLEGTPDRCTVGLWSTDKAVSEGTQLKEESVYSLFRIPSVCFTLCFSIPSHLSLPNVALFSTSDRGFRTMFFCQPLFSKDRCLWQIGEDLQEPTQQWKLGLKKKILHKAHLHCSVSKYFSKSVSRSLNSFEEMPMWSFSQLYVSLFKADRGTEEASSASPSTPGLCLLLKGFQQTTVLLSSCFLFHHHKTSAVRSSSHLASD